METESQTSERREELRVLEARSFNARLDNVENQRLQDLRRIEASANDDSGLPEWVPAHARAEVVQMHLSLREIERAAAAMVESLAATDAGFVRLAPGDGTVYEISMIRLGPETYASEFEYVPYGLWMSSNFGPGYLLAGGVAPTESGYVADKWAEGRQWTGMVFWLFQLAVFSLAGPTAMEVPA